MDPWTTTILRQVSSSVINIIGLDVQKAVTCYSSFPLLKIAHTKLATKFFVIIWKDKYVRFKFRNFATFL